MRGIRDRAPRQGTLFGLVVAAAVLWLALDPNGTAAGGVCDFVLADSPEECTIGVAGGLVTADGRPLLWKVRDSGQEAARQQLGHISGSPFSYLGVRTEGEGIYMGLNEAGVASGNALVRLTSASAPNSLVQSVILRSYSSVDQIENYFRSGQQAGTCQASGCFPQGNCMCACATGLGR